MSEATPTPKPSFPEMVRTFGHIGLINFGGPAGQIALMHRVLIDEKRWFDEDAFLRALNFCHLLPGPEAQQLATYLGWKLYGVRGGLVAGVLFIVPGAVVVLALSALYAYAADLGPVAAALLGVKAAVLAIVVEALLRIARRALNTPLKRGIAVAAFVALAALSAPFPLVILAAGVVGFAVAATRPEALKLKNVAPAADRPPAGSAVRASLSAILVWGLIWAAPLVLLFVLLGPRHVLFEIAVFFSKLAAVSFGGAYAVLTYMAQEAVETHGWLRPKEMVDGLGLAETTPGPLILVTEYVGFLAAFRNPAPFTPLVAGTLGAVVTLWTTFAPCFLWIFAGAPFIERLEHARRLQGALAAITAAVVGVIGNLTLWFALHVLFARFPTARIGPVSFEAPDLSSLDVRAVILTAVALLLLFRLKVGVLRTLGAAMAMGLAFHVLGAA